MKEVASRFGVETFWNLGGGGVYDLLFAGLWFIDLLFAGLGYIDFFSRPRVCD